MIEIVPNWHPIFVHFTVALLSLSVVFALINTVLHEGKLKAQWLILAHWHLWLGTAFGIVTALTGWDAYNTVTHDVPSHVAMTEHLYWALATIFVFVLLSLWSVWRVHKLRKTGALFALCLLAGGGLLASTAWHGGELVYRFGLGVMSLPQAEEDETKVLEHDHAHDAADVHLKDEVATTKLPIAEATQAKPTSPTQAIKRHNADGHTHAH